MLPLELVGLVMLLGLLHQLVDLIFLCLHVLIVIVCIVLAHHDLLILLLDRLTLGMLKSKICWLLVALDRKTKFTVGVSLGSNRFNRHDFCRRCSWSWSRLKFLLLLYVQVGVSLLLMNLVEVVCSIGLVLQEIVSRLCMICI